MRVVIYRHAAYHLKRLRKLLVKVSISQDQIMHAVTQLVVYYAVRVSWLDVKHWRQRLLPGKVATPEAKWLLIQEARTWKLLRDAISLVRGGQFKICACAGQGYDVLLAARDNVKRLWLHHPSFVDSLLDASQQAHHLSLMQSCIEAEDMQYALIEFQRTLSKTNCVAGDVATNIAIAQACLLHRKWARVAELYLLSFALVVAAPWTDCLDRQFWDISAEDVLYNVARAVVLAWTDIADELLEPAQAVRKLGWRSSPGTLLPWNRPQCWGPKVLNQLCLRDGRMHVLPEDFHGALGALCSEFGAFESGQWVSSLGAAGGGQQKWRSDQIASFGKLFVLPIGTPYPNLWHALHWWIPSVALMQKQGWTPSDTHLRIVFDSRPRGGGRRWDVERPESVDIVRFLAFHDAILQLLSQNPVRFVAHESDISCSREAVIGFGNLRYDMTIPQIGHYELQMFRYKLQAAATKQGLDQIDAAFSARVLIVQRATGRARYITNIGLLQQSLRRNPRFDTEIQQLEAHTLLQQFVLVWKATSAARRD